MASVANVKVGDLVKVKATNWEGLVVDVSGEVAAIDVWHAGTWKPGDRARVIAHEAVPYTLDELEPLLLQEGPQDGEAVHLNVPTPPGEPNPSGLGRALCGSDRGASTTSLADVTCPRCVLGASVAADVEAAAFEKREPTERERMRVRSQMPELDDVFPTTLDFPGAEVVGPGRWAERSFAMSRECRLDGIRKPKGLRLERIVLKVGPDFRPVPKKGDGTDPPYTDYEGKDCLIFSGEQIAEGGWKRQRLAPDRGCGVYLLVKNETADDLRFEGTLRLVEDRVPEPDHEDV